MNITELLGPEWYSTTIGDEAGVAIHRDSRGQGRVDVRMKYPNGVAHVHVGIKLSVVNTTRYSYEAWAYRDYTMQREQIPARRSQRSEMLRNMAHTATLHIENLRFRSKKI